MSHPDVRVPSELIHTRMGRLSIYIALHPIFRGQHILCGRFKCSGIKNDFKYLRPLPRSSADHWSATVTLPWLALHGSLPLFKTLQSIFFWCICTCWFLVVVYNLKQSRSWLTISHHSFFFGQAENTISHHSNISKPCRHIICHGTDPQKKWDPKKGPT